MVSNTQKPFCIVRNLNWTGEVLLGEWDGEKYYVLSDGDCYTPQALSSYESEFVSLSELELALRTADGFQNRLFAWAKSALPADANHFKKLQEEFKELLDYPKDPQEMADVFLALMLHAQANGICLMEAAHEKFGVVKGRVYGPCDENGISRHIETE